MEAYFVNPVTRKASKGKKTKRRKKMAKRRQPAALRKYWASKKKSKSKSRRKTRRAKKSSPPKSRKSRKTSRRRHPVKSYRRRGGSVGSYRRKGARVRKHWSNPMGLGNLGSTTLDGLIMAGVFFGALFAVGYANGWVKRVPILAAGWGELAGKLGLALGVSVIAQTAMSRRWLKESNRNAVILAGFAPLALGLLGRVAPQIAGSISLGDDEYMGAELGMSPGDRLSDYTMDAELAAELSAGERESESSNY